MSDSGQRLREWRFYVQDMIEFGEKALSYTEGLDQNAFVADSLTYDATIHNLALIGEAATHIPDAIREQHPEVPWRAIVGTRNRIIHAYLGVDGRCYLEHYPRGYSEFINCAKTDCTERSMRGSGC